LFWKGKEKTEKEKSFVYFRVGGKSKPPQRSGGARYRLKKKGKGKRGTPVKKKGMKGGGRRSPTPFFVFLGAQKKK